MSKVRLPILSLSLKQQRYSCHGCGNCCRDFTVQLRDEDIAKLHEQGWERKLGEPVTIEFRGRTFLRQREDGSCIFLDDKGLCSIHTAFGFEKKPVACQLFPFHLTPTHRGVQKGLNFACQSVMENKGAALPSHDRDLRRQLGNIPEAQGASPPPMLTDRRRAEPVELDAVQSHFDDWLRSDHDLSVRLRGMAWVAASLADANLQIVKGSRVGDLLDVLFGALPEELDHYDHDPPTGKQNAMLRRAIFSRVEDPKLNRIKAAGWLRTVFSQLGRERRFARARGLAPQVGHDWPAEVPFAQVELVQPCDDPGESLAIDDLLTRYLRASILGGRMWGAGYYGWPVTRGLQALTVNAAAIGWLARLHAAGRGLERVDLAAVRAAVGRIDRTSGRAPWLGSAGERLRLVYLNREHGLWRLVQRWSPILEALSDDLTPDER